jgi:hypothetical protein
MKIFYKIFIFIILFLILFSTVIYCNYVSVSPEEIMPYGQQEPEPQYKIIQLIRTIGILLSVILIPIGIIFGIISIQKNKKVLGIFLIIIPFISFIIFQLLGLIATLSLAS